MAGRRWSSSATDPVKIVGVIAAILILLAAAFEIGHVTRHKDKLAAGTTTTTVAPQVLGEKITTSTTEPPSSSTLAPAEATTTTTAAPATTATTAAPATTPTTHAPTQSCGTGQISARASVATKPTSPADGTWTSTGTVQVTNGTDKSMQIDRLVAHLEYADGTFDVIDVGAAGVVLSPGQVSNFDFTKRTARQPTTVTVSDFAAHPVGHPECATQPA